MNIYVHVNTVIYISQKWKIVQIYLYPFSKYLLRTYYIPFRTTQNHYFLHKIYNRLKKVFLDQMQEFLRHYKSSKITETCIYYIISLLFHYICILHYWLLNFIYWQFTETFRTSKVNLDRPKTSFPNKSHFFIWVLVNIYKYIILLS